MCASPGVILTCPSCCSRIETTRTEFKNHPRFSCPTFDALLDYSRIVVGIKEIPDSVKVEVRRTIEGCQRQDGQ